MIVRDWYAFFSVVMLLPVTAPLLSLYLSSMVRMTLQQLTGINLRYKSLVTAHESNWDLLLVVMELWK